MKQISELTDLQNPAWPELRSFFETSKNGAEVLFVDDSRRAQQALVELQVSTRSYLGAMAFETGGVLVDHRFVRLFGGGCAALPSLTTTWDALPGAVVVGIDAIGGVFAVNAGGLDGALGQVSYFAPDSLRWEPLKTGYAEFLLRMLNDDLGAFYGDLRWPGWKDDCMAISPDKAFSQSPPLWAAEGKPGRPVSRRAVDARDLVAMSLDIARQLDG